jgi:hypothetical protein
VPVFSEGGLDLVAEGIGMDDICDFQQGNQGKARLISFPEWHLRI